MSTALEHRYRRLLRLLPANYRYHWEEDMVGAFMEGAHTDDQASGRPARGERLSVVALAARLRLSGEHATPRGLVWYQALHGLALLILLYQALSATMSVAYRARDVVTVFPVQGAWSYFGFFLWSPVLNLFWLAAFVCFVLGRLAAARVLAVLGALGGVAMAVVPYVIARIEGMYILPFGPHDVSRYGWLAVSVGTVLLCSRAMPVSRPLWLGTYVVSSIVLVPMMLNVFAPFGIGHQYADLTDNVSMVSIVAMVGALTLAAMGWPPSTRWLLALAVFGGGVAAVRLLTVVPAPLPPFGLRRPADLSQLAGNLDLVAVGLAIVCAVVALLLLRRLPGSASASSAVADAPS
jgi:hypothetical protein